MIRIAILALIFAWLAVAVTARCDFQSQATVETVAARSPNFIFILSDNIAQGDVGAYGQKLIQTPPSAIPYAP